MATVRALIRTSSTKRKNEPSAAVRFRLCDGRARQLFYTSEIKVGPAAWDAKRECLKSKMMDSIERSKTSSFQHSDPHNLYRGIILFLLL